MHSHLSDNPNRFCTPNEQSPRENLKKKEGLPNYTSCPIRIQQFRFRFSLANTALYYKVTGRENKMYMIVC